MNKNSHSPAPKILSKKFEGPGQLFHKKGKVDLSWDDEGVLPKILSLDTEFVFRRMTEETLAAVAAEKGSVVLDVGCGRAIDAIALAKKGLCLYACDPSPIMLHKAKEGIEKSGQMVTLVRSLAEDLPFRPEVFSRVYCKGAIDHFANPEQALAEMCRVTKRGGKVIIAVANLESLSCALAKGINTLFKFFLNKEIARPHIWETPADHNFKFTYPTLRALGKIFLQRHSLKGISLFWGFPKWSKFLKNLPRCWGLKILKIFDWWASWYAPWGDVLIMVGQPRKIGREEGRKIYD
ncbi:MAG: class I SAM-dependent methyltransferase [Thermodesulfobacteriota bacterium]